MRFEPDILPGWRTEDPTTYPSIHSDLARTQNARIGKPGGRIESKSRRKITTGRRAVIRGCSPRRLHFHPRYGAGRRLGRPYVYASPPRLRTHSTAAIGMSESHCGALCQACRRGDGSWLSRDLHAHVRYRIIARRYATAPGAVHRGASKITKPGLGTVTGGRQPEVSRFRHVSGRACRSSVQVNGQDRWDEAASGRPEGRGIAVAANQYVLKITRPGPTCRRSRAATRANWPVRQA
jgi:hypothetical protein